MKDGEKKVWITLLIVVLCAVIIGLFYWLGQQKTQDTEGYLVEAIIIENEAAAGKSVESVLAIERENADAGVTVYGI